MSDTRKALTEMRECFAEAATAVETAQRATERLAAIARRVVEAVQTRRPDEPERAPRKRAQRR